MKYKQKTLLVQDKTKRDITIVKEDMEEIGLAKAMRKGRTGEYIDTEDFLKKLRATNTIHN